MNYLRPNRSYVVLNPLYSVEIELVETLLVGDPLYWGITWNSTGASTLCRLGISSSTIL